MSRNGKSEGVDVGAMARFLNVGERRVQQLADEGIVKKLKRGRYDAIPSIHAYIRYWQERAEGKGSAGSDEIRRELLEIDRDSRLLDLQRKRGDLVTLDFMEEELAAALEPVDGLLGTLPGRITPRAVGRTEAEIYAAVAKEVEEMRRALRGKHEDSDSEEEDDAGAEDAP